MTSTQNDIAVIGLSCRFPGASNADAFWENLRNGLESISFFTDEELIASGIDSQTLADPLYVKAAGILENIEDFDAQLLGYSPREAALIDPQQRVFLECAWEALEHAGQDPDSFPGPIGVFGGARTSDYLLQNIYANPSLRQSLSKLDIELGNDVDYLATRVAYKLNLKAPCYTVQTACSTSLVAVCMACDSLLSGQSDIALAGGASIALPQKQGYQYVEGNIFSVDGHCRAFDANAGGVVFSNGVGLVALKRLDDALGDGDFVHAVIKGYALNNDGSSKVGFTAPSVEGQAQVITDALAMSGVPAESVTYVEVHGTGTALGDPIEIEALTQAFRAQTDRTAYCGVGSVKTNIGHTFVAAGAASLIKTLLAIRHGQIPPSLHFREPNPNIGFAESPFYVASKLQTWETEAEPRRAGVSSFGVGGTNAHVILEQAPPRAPSGDARPYQLLALSAGTGTALDTATSNLCSHLRDHPDINLADTAYTLQTGRKALDVRSLCVSRDRAQAISSLQEPDTLCSGTPDSEEHEVAFLFSGQGAQYVNMGKDLYQHEPFFRKQVDACSELLAPHIGLDLREALYPEEETDEDSARLARTALTQPALFVIELALARLCMSWGIKPGAMIGHSIGEYAAACVAGVFSLEDALVLVAQRGRLMQSMPLGSMLAVFTPPEDVTRLLSGSEAPPDLSLSAVNGPSLCVVSGPTPAVEQFEKDLSAKEIAFRRLHTSHAFHSPMMEPIQSQFAEAARKMDLRAPETPYVSNVTGTWIREDEATDPSFWGRHVREPVHFSQGLQALCAETKWHLLELGPGRTLCSLVKQHKDLENVGQVLPSLPHPRAREPDQAFFLTSIGKLWLAGVKIDWTQFHAGWRRQRLPLPTYPFERKRYWLDAPTTHEDGAEPVMAQQKVSANQWLYIPSWKRTLPLSAPRPARQKDRWLVFMDHARVGTRLLQLPGGEEPDVATVTAGAEFKVRGELEYTVNPRADRDYEALACDLRERRFIPSKIVHLWGLNPGCCPPDGVGGFHETQQWGFSSLVSLALSLERAGIASDIDLDVVTCRLHAATDSRESLCVANTTVLAACRVIPQEYANITCRNMDLNTAEPDDLVLVALRRELEAHTTDATVALRGGLRWVPVFERAASFDMLPESDRLRKGGTYLVTGGLGRIGLVFAGHLARGTGGNIALLTRSGLPPRDEWEQRLREDGPDPDIRRKIHGVQEIEKTGAKVMLLKADLADERRMREAIGKIIRQFGTLNGVIHASGHFARAPLQETDGPFCDPLFRAKVDGMYVLERVLKGLPLDFCVLTSSLSSILGGLGYAGYSAANIFMDAFAQQPGRERTVPWITINWDEWNFGRTSGDGPKSAPDAEDSGILPQEGGDTLLRILSRDAGTQVAVSTRDLQTRLDQWTNPTERQDTPQDGQQTATPCSPRPDLASVYVAPGSETEKSISAVWQELLGVEKVGLHDNFFELGGHSLLATQVVARLRKAFHMELPVVALFENPTVHSLGNMLVSTEQPGADASFEEQRHRGTARKKRKTRKAPHGKNRSAQ